MSEKRKYHFASETAIGYVEGDLYLEIDGNDLEGSFDMGEAKMRLRDGYYAFVCEKCAPTFDYYGWFAEAEKLNGEAARIYAGT